jgi:polysaccharide biosynthesis transport protein
MSAKKEKSMFENQKVDYFSQDRFAQANNQEYQMHAQFRQKRKWQILSITFVLTFVVANLFVWLRSPVYQSQAILQFTSMNNLAITENEQWQQAIEVNRQRLKSDSVLNKLADNIMQQYGITKSVAELNQTLSIESNLISNILILEAKGVESEQLKPIIDTWINDYLLNLESENGAQNKDELYVLRQQLSALQDKIIVQRQTVDDFARLNEIISLERDENQILSKIKGLNSNLEEAENQKTNALATLESLNQSLEKGIPVIRPSDTEAIAVTRAKLEGIQAEFKALRNRYTPEYIARDPILVAKQQEAVDLEYALKQQINESQIDYLTDSQRMLEVAANKATMLRAQVNEQRKVAQQFNQKLEQYKVLEGELQELQGQEQILKSRLVEKELARPFETKITVLEPASNATYPVGPNYWRDAFFALVLALVLSLLSVALFSFIVRPRNETQSAPNIVVVPHYGSNNTAEITQRKGIEQALPSEPILGLSHSKEVKATRIMQINESKSLFNAANKQGKTLIGLIFCGVALDEIEQITRADFSEQFTSLHIQDATKRRLVIPPNLATHLQLSYESLEDTKSLISSDLNEADLSSLLVNAAYDADLVLPEQITLTVLRHTYIRYLVEQGAKLNDIELLCGFVAPTELTHFRQFKQGTKSVELVDINTVYPIF